MCPILFEGIFALGFGKNVSPFCDLACSTKSSASKVVNKGVKTFVDVANWYPFKTVACNIVVLVASNQILGGRQIGKIIIALP